MVSNTISSLATKTEIEKINELIQKIQTDLIGKKDTLYTDYQASKAERKRLAAIAEQQRLAEQERLAAIAEKERLAAIAKEERLERSKKAGRCNVEKTAYGHSFRSAPYKEIGGVQNRKYQSNTFNGGQLIAMCDTP